MVPILKQSCQDTLHHLPIEVILGGISFFDALAYPIAVPRLIFENILLKQ